MPKYNIYIICGSEDEFLDKSKELSDKYKSLADIKIISSPLNSLDSVLSVTKDLNDIDIVFCAAGMLSPQTVCEKNLTEVEQLMSSNYLIPAYFISLIKTKMNRKATVIIYFLQQKIKRQKI